MALKISVVSPVFLAERIVDKLCDELISNLSSITMEFEIILVEDGSPDKSWQKILENCKKDSRIIGIKLSRNFGQHYAITAGLENAKGDWIIVMDCDLQDRPDQILKLYNKAREGFDIVYARRVLRKDSFFKIISSKLFYMLFSFLTETEQDASIANFGIYNRKVILAILEMKDYIRFFPTMSQWVGFQKCSINIEHNERLEGKSSYSWSKLISLALNNTIAFSDKPLKLTIQLGFFITFITSIVGVSYLSSYFLGHTEVEGFTSLIISVWFLSGIIIFCLGMLGIYIGKIFEKVKNRPSFIIEKKIN